jgi:hypothetical protein
MMVDSAYDRSWTVVPVAGVMESRGLLVVKPIALCGGLPKAFSLQVETVGVVNEAVEDRVGERRICDHVVPVLDGDLAGDDRRSTSMAVVDNLKQVASLLSRHRRPVARTAIKRLS